MKPVNFDLKLSKYFDISINFNSRQIALFRATGYNSAGCLIRDGHDFLFNLFIPKTDDITALKPFFQLVDIEEKARYYFYSEKIQDPYLSGFLGDLDSINGLVISYAGIESGKLKLQGFMHTNSETDFSNLLSKYNYMQVNIEKLTFKPSMGFYNFMKNMEIPLKSITISLPMSEFSQYQIIKVLKGTNTVIQYVDNITKGGKFRIILYSDSNLGNVEGIKVISDIDHIYETSIDESILVLFASNIIKNNITSNFTFMYESEDKLLLNFIVPEFMAKEYFRLIVDTEIDLKNFEWVTLESYGDLDNFERSFNQ